MGRMIVKKRDFRTLVCFLGFILLFLIAAASSQAIVAGMPVPPGQQEIYYNQIASPVLTDDPLEAKPVGFGSVAQGGNTLSVRFSLPAFDGPVDIYAAFTLSTAPDYIFILNSDGQTFKTFLIDDVVQQFAMGTLPSGVEKWKSNQISPIDDTSFGDIPLSSLEAGTYYVYFLVTPAGRVDRYYLWETYFSVMLPGKYFLAFHACDRSAKDCVTTNTNHSIYLAYSDDGVSWSPLPNYTPFQGSVPDVVKRGDTLYIYTPDPDKVTRYSISTGTTDSKLFTITKSDGSKDDLGDVSAYLDPSTNKIVIFYKSTATIAPGQDPALCTTCPFRSATEVEGSDGTAFLMDNGDRVSDQLSDEDLFYDGSKYILYFGKNAQAPGEKSKTFVYTSTTLGGTYTTINTLTGGVLTESGSAPAGYFDMATGKYWTYITVLSPNAPAVIKRAIHSDFSKQLTDADFTTVISGDTYPGLGSSYTVEGPGFAENK